MVLILCPTAHALVMTFTGGTVYYTDMYNEEHSMILPEYGMRQPPYDKITGYEEDDIFLDISTGYEVALGKAAVYADHPGFDCFSILVPFRTVSFHLTSNDRFNLDSLFLVIASNTHGWELTDEPDLGTWPIDYWLTASNGASYHLPAHSNWQNELIEFGEQFKNIESFSLSYTGWYGDDPVLILDNIAVTPIPEPTSFALFGFGIICFLRSRKLLKNKNW